jgi:AraC-like DNA-binding protein
MLQEFSGASVRRTIDRSGAQVPEHAHDWPLLSLFVIGGYANHTELGERFIAGPSAILYAAGAAHRNTAGADGFEQIEIEFDPAWLGASPLPSVPVLRWLGGHRGAAAHVLAVLCSHDLSEQALRAALRQFLTTAPSAADAGRPPWMDGVTRHLKDEPARKVADLAREAGLHPSWLGTAYRRAAGESLLDAAARFRVEHATRLLRETDSAFSDIAMDAGFCDQSHMIRNFRRVLGRLPSAVREDRQHFRQY